jgi:hypothetical protein
MGMQPADRSGRSQRAHSEAGFAHRAPTFVAAPALERAAAVRLYADCSQRWGYRRAVRRRSRPSRMRSSPQANSTAFVVSGPGEFRCDLGEIGVVVQLADRLRSSLHGQPVTALWFAGWPARGSASPLARSPSYGAWRVARRHGPASHLPTSSRRRSTGTPPFSLES